MPKIAAVAVLSIAAFAGCASVRGQVECVTADQEQGGEESRCYGPQESQKRQCCEGYKCVQQNEYYGQCLDVSADIPPEWDGNEIPFGEDSISPPMPTPKPGPSPGPGPSPIQAPTPAPGLMITRTETPAEGPGFSISPVGNYMRIIAKDYVPSTSPPNMVMVEDIVPPGGSSIVESQNECERKCSATEGCNAASYYTDASDLPNGQNCWLKIMENSCELPADSIDNANAILLLKLAGCGFIGADAPLDIAMEPDAMAPGPDTLGGVVGDIAPRAAEDLGELAAPASENVTDASAAVSILTASAALLTAAGAVVCTALL